MIDIEKMGVRYMEQLLIVEDDIGLNQGLCKALKADARQIISCQDLKTAKEQLLCGGVSLILLDINLPDGSGLELLREILRVFQHSVGRKLSMKLLRKINNNAAVAQDNRGREMVVLGRGVGFHPMPYELTDLSVVYRTFYDVDPQYYEILSNLPEDALLAAADIRMSQNDNRRSGQRRIFCAESQGCGRCRAACHSGLAPGCMSMSGSRS